MEFQPTITILLTSKNFREFGKFDTYGKIVKKYSLILEETSVGEMKFKSLYFLKLKLTGNPKDISNLLRDEEILKMMR